MQEGWLGSLEAMLEHELAYGATDDPFRPAVLRWAAETGRDADPTPLLDHLEATTATGRAGWRRFRWRLPVARWLPDDVRLRWRPAEIELAQRHPDEHANRLWLPLVLVEHVQWLEELAAGPDPALAARAAALLAEATPTLEDVVAQRVGGIDAWADTFLAWMFVRRPRALERVRALCVALTARYAAQAARTNGVVRGRSFPWYDVPLPSATAHVALAGSRVGEGVEELGSMLAFLRDAKRPTGWGDPHEESDLLTTLAVAEVLGSLDPTFDLAPVLSQLGRLAVASGPRPVLIDPEWPWLATELLRFHAWAMRPFPDRFQWPNAARWSIDPIIDIPRYELFLMLARLFERVPALEKAPIEVAFIDFANFGPWNKDYGQIPGDHLLRLAAGQLKRVADSRVIRIGGDELLVVGSPFSTGLEERLRTTFAAWPFVARADDKLHDKRVVPMRAALRGTGLAGDLVEIRRRLGEEIAPLKNTFPDPPPEGIICRVD